MNNIHSVESVLYYVYCLVKRKKIFKRTDITPEMVAFLEKASGVIRKPDP